MARDLHNIEDLFRSALSDNDQMPSAKVWNALDSRLDKDIVADIKTKYKTWKRLSLLLLLLLIVLGIYELNLTNTKLVKLNELKRIKETVSNDGSNTALSKLHTNKPGNFLEDIQSLNAGGHFPVTDTSKNNSNKIITSELIIDNPSFTRHNNYSYEALILPRQLDFLLPEMTSDAMEGEKIPETVAVMKKTPFFAGSVATSSPKREPEQLKRFSIAAFFSPDRASYRLEKGDLSTSQFNADRIKQSEQHEFSSTSGILVDYRLNSRWSLQSGITFSNTNISIEPQILYAEKNNTGDVKYQINFSSGSVFTLPTFQRSPVVGDSIYASAAVHKLRYVGIPVALEYRLTKGKLSLEVMAGAGINILTKGKLETELQQGTNNEIDILDNIQGLKSIYINGLTGLGANYTVTKRISLTVMPTARFALTPINKGSVVKTYPSTVGVAIGLKIKL